ncbi:MAG TPA: hypothetical protein VEG44_04830 [Candidatus Acidoferrales bacterium]|nr:hypothetical protein [Candidatus Acidoferrales bacterium]
MGKAFRVQILQIVMTTPKILILDANDRTIYTIAMQQLRRIDREICRQKQSFRNKHKTHVKSMLHFILPDIHEVEIRAKEIKDKNLRLELREEIVERKRKYYELYDEVQDTIFLNRGFCGHH